MKLPFSDSFRDVFRQRVWTLDRMAVIHLQSAYRSFLYPPSFFSQHLPLILPRPLLRIFSRPLLRICHSRSLRIVFSVHLIVSPSPDVVFKGSSIFFCALTEVVLVPYCTSIITALYKGVLVQPLAVEFAPSQQVSIIGLAMGSLSHRLPHIN